MDYEIEAKLKAVTEENRRRLDEMDTELARLKSPILHDAGSLDKRLTAEQKAYGQFLRKGINALEPEERKVLVISDDPTAGYLAPPQIANEIIKIAIDNSPLRQICRVVSINRESPEVPKRTGHGDAAWVSETGTRSETTGLAFSMERLTKCITWRRRP